MDVLRIQRTPSWCQPKFIILGDGVDTIANDRVKLYNFKFVAYTDIYRVWSGRYLLFPKSEPDLVDLANCVIDAPPRCSLSLAARVTVEPAGHSGACHCREPEEHRVELGMHACMI